MKLTVSSRGHVPTHRQIFYPVVVATSSAMALTPVVGLVSTVGSEAFTRALLVVAMSAVVVLLVRALRVSWKVQDQRLEIRGVLVNRTFDVADIESISLKRSLLPVSVGCWSIDLRDGRHRRVPSTMRLGDQASRFQGEALRVALELPKDSVF